MPTTAAHQVRPELVQQGLLAPIDSVTPHPDNPNDGDPDAITESLLANGMYRPIVTWRRPGGGPEIILAGNTTYAACMQLGWTHLARTWIEADTEAEAVRILLADNRYARLAQMNQAQELALLRSLDDLTGTGYSYDDQDDIAAALDAIAVLPIHPTDAAYAETDQDEADRQAARAGGTFAGRGVREMLLLFPADEYDQVNMDLDTLRGQWGSGLTNAQVFAKAAQVAVDHA